MIDLLNCPFCDKPPAVIDDDSYGCAAISCIHCEAVNNLSVHVSADIGEMDKLISVWNRRQPSEPFMWWNPTDERALSPELVKHADHPEDFTVPLYAHAGPSADVDEAKEREAFRKHYGAANDTNALPMYETMVQIWIDSARARAGKG